MRSLSLSFILLTTFFAGNRFTVNAIGQQDLPTQAGKRAVETNKALISAALKDDAGSVKALLKAGADPNFKFYDKGLEQEVTILMKAVMYSNVKVVNSLLAAGADVNESDQFGRTSLIFASGRDNIDIVKALLRAGADVNAQMQSGITPLFVSVISGYEDIGKVLIEAGANVNIYVNGNSPSRENDVFTPLLLAVMNGNDEFVEILLNAGADASAKNRDGKTSLMIATENNRTVIKQLLEAVETSK